MDDDEPPQGSSSPEEQQDSWSPRGLLNGHTLDLGALCRLLPRPQA